MNAEFYPIKLKLDKLKPESASLKHPVDALKLTLERLKSILSGIRLKNPKPITLLIDPTQDSLILLLHFTRAKRMLFFQG